MLSLRGELYEEFTMKIIIIVCLCIASALLFHQCGATSRDSAHTSATALEDSSAPSADASGRTKTVAKQIPSKEERLLMSKKDRIALLEKLGCVPEDADMSDYFLAEETSWWGKRLDPEEFWKDRVVWYDWAIVRDANRYGRSYPPMPYEDPSVADRSDTDRQSSGNSGDSSTPKFIWNERESAFWTRFIKNHPHPPDDIARRIQNEGDMWLSTKHQIETDPTYVTTFRVRKNILSEMLDFDSRNAKALGYPIESATQDAYMWDHVMRKRKEYEEFTKVASADNLMDDKFFWRKVYVDRTLITEPLTPEQINAANEWKVKYLRRLRTEKWDESYINAYKEAWNLTENDLTE